MPATIVPPTIYHSLRTANLARDALWDPLHRITGSRRGNELGGEVGEALTLAMDLLAVAAASGRSQNTIKKLEREALGLMGSRSSSEALANELADVVICADLAAMHYGICLHHAVEAKFNASSTKLNLPTLLQLNTEF
jgi:hypothetical protein